MDGLIELCPICGEHSVQIVNTAAPTVFYAACGRISDCGYRTPFMRSNEEAVAWHNGLIDRLMSYTEDAFNSNLESFQAWKEARGLA
jgi:hypothetical protein